MYRFTRTAVADNRILVAVSMLAFAGLCTVLLMRIGADISSAGVLAWWSMLCVVSVGNICGWRLSAAALARRKAVVDPDLNLFQRRQLMLSLIYVLGCAFRSILPRADVQRFGLFDSWLSSVMVGRSVATVAELCFVAQWALVVNRLAGEAQSKFWVRVSWLLVPLIVVAEMCSWYGVLTTAYIGNAVEESLWAITAFLTTASFVALWSRSAVAYRPFLAAGIVIGISYVAYMCTVDVPMYASRFLADEAQGREYLTLSQGFLDAGSRWIVSYSWDHWQPEIAWMSLYFSVGVWCSIALVHSPRFGLMSGAEFTSIDDERLLKT